MNSERERLISKLIDTFHLNMSERQVLGPSPITFPEIRNAMKMILLEHGWLPSKARLHDYSAPAFEGYFIQRSPEGRFLLHYQRSQATAPSQLAESSSEEFPDLDTVARTYLNREHQYTIDGIHLPVS